MIKILFLSEITDKGLTASSVLLDRHFKKLKIRKIVLDTFKIDPPFSKKFRFFIKPFKILPFGIYEFFLECIEPKIVLNKLLVTKIKNQSYDIVLSLAHGRFGLHSWWLAKKLKVPNVVFFHDWWPEIFFDHLRKGKQIAYFGVKHDFIKIQKKSDLCFAICPGMAEKLRYSKRKKVLYPIPDDKILSVTKNKWQLPCRLIYTGSLWYPYGNMVLSLYDEIKSEKLIKFKIFGDPKYIREDQRINLMKNKTLNYYIFGKEYNRLITEKAEILLAVMGRDLPGKNRMQTSFPSKVANYFQTGNAVLIWALPGSSLNNFCKKYDYPWLVQSEKSSDVKKMLKNIISTPARLKCAQNDSKQIRQKVFDSNKIQDQFEKTLLDIVKNK